MVSSQKQQGFRFKKINISFAALLAVAMCFFVSCGGGSSKPENGGDSVSNFGKLGGECYPNETCDKGLLCDTANNICIEDPDNPTDTEQNEHDNNHDINDNQWEQPDENHQETPDNQWEQPDGNHNENPDNQWEQPDENHQENPDNQWEQPDENHQENPDNQWEQPDEDHNETPDEQNNEGKCDPGYVWVDFDLQPYLSSYEGFVDKQCVSCKTTPWLVSLLEEDYYCPGGDDLKGKNVQGQIELCPQYTYANADYSDCICSYGVPPSGKTCYDLVHGTKKPLIISPKVNVNTSNSSL